MYTSIRSWLPRQARAGQSMVEFALIVPALLMLIFGIIEGGRLVYTYTTISSAAREGARFAIINPTDTTGIRNAVISRAAGLTVPAGNITITCAPCTAGNSIRVSVTYTFQSLASFVLPNVTLNTAATMYIE